MHAHVYLWRFNRTSQAIRVPSVRLDSLGADATRALEAPTTTFLAMVQEVAMMESVALACADVQSAVEAQPATNDRAQRTPTMFHVASEASATQLHSPAPAAALDSFKTCPPGYAVRAPLVGSGPTARSVAHGVGSVIAQPTARADALVATGGRTVLIVAQAARPTRAVATAYAMRPRACALAPNPWSRASTPEPRAASATLGTTRQTAMSYAPQLEAPCALGGGRASTGRVLRVSRRLVRLASLCTHVVTPAS